MTGISPTNADWAGAPASTDVAGYEIDGASPASVVSPRSVDELGQVLAHASQSGLAVAPWGGGTRIATGNPPQRLDAVVTLAHIDGLLAHNPADLTATVEAGMKMAALQRLLAEHGQFLAIDSPLPELATVGGTLARGVGGPMTWQSWSPRDVVIGMKVVLPNGKTSKSGGQVVKNVTGYDMARLHIGGLGTLGIIAEVSFKLTPLPQRQATIVASFGSRDECFRAARRVLARPFFPLAVSTFDRESATRMKRRQVGGDHTLAVRLGGRPRTLERQVREARAACDEYGPASLDLLDDVEAEGLWRRIADFAWDDGSSPLVGCRASVPPSEVPKLVEELVRSAPADGPAIGVVCHPGYGTVLAGWYGDENHPLEALTALVVEARAATHRAGGNLVVERCPTELKAHIDVWGKVAEPLAIMRRMKEQYDSGRVLNPGRFVGGI